MKKILFSTLLFILYSSVVYSQTSCQAMFTYSGTGGSPNIISFTNSSSIGGNPIFSTVSYFWDFGDNNMDTVQNPIHTYINNGIYYPCLTITVVDTIELKTHKTKDLIALLKPFKLSDKLLIISDIESENINLASRNIEKLKLIKSEGVNVYDLLNYKSILIDKATLTTLVERLK